MTEYKQYRRKQVAEIELRAYQHGDDLNGVSISDVDRNAGSPKSGDMIARNPKNHARHRNVYDCDGEYEFPVVRHWIAAEAWPFPEETRSP